MANYGLRARDLSGQVFGRLTVIARDLTPRTQRAPYFECRCECGKRVVARSANLTSGQTRSCGCGKKYHGMKHGHSSRTVRSRTYTAWVQMLAKCVNPKNEKYKYYGAKGITVCLQWQDFRAFLADMGEVPDGQTIERIERSGDYEPGNCRWAPARTH